MRDGDDVPEHHPDAPDGERGRATAQGIVVDGGHADEDHADSQPEGRPSGSTRCRGVARRARRRRCRARCRPRRAVSSSPNWPASSPSDEPGPTAYSTSTAPTALEARLKTRSSRRASSARGGGAGTAAPRRRRPGPRSVLRRAATVNEPRTSSSATSPEHPERRGAVRARATPSETSTAAERRADELVGGQLDREHPPVGPRQLLAADDLRQDRLGGGVVHDLGDAGDHRDDVQQPDRGRDPPPRGGAVASEGERATRSAPDHQPPPVVPVDQRRPRAGADQPGQRGRRASAPRPAPGRGSWSPPPAAAPTLKTPSARLESPEASPEPPEPSTERARLHGWDDATSI